MSEPLALYTTPALAEALSPRAHVAGLLQFERALARAEAAAGVIPAAAAAAIADACRVELYDVAALYAEAARAGTLAIPLVAALAARAGEGGPFVHLGATSQDAVDTALSLQLREALRLIDGELLRLCAASAALAEAHRATLMPARTLLQQALPMPFGLKAARWLALAVRQARALRRQRAGLAAQLGGAAGTLAALGERGLAVAAGLAAELGLAEPDLPWHAERDRTAELAGALGVAAGAAVKVALDVLLMAQGEVGEASERAEPGKGGSSALPHKRNPVDATLAAAAARLAIGQVPVVLSAMAQEHERAAGAWQAEWQALPDLARYAGGAVARAADAVAGLEVDPARMRENLGLAGGALMAEALGAALAPHLGPAEARRAAGRAASRAAASRRTLAEAAAEDPAVIGALGAAGLAAALEPAGYLGSSAALIDRALESYRALLAEN